MLYVAVINPVLKGADYTVAKILYEVFPTEVQTIFPTYRDSFAAGLSRTNLSLVQDFSAAGQGQTPGGSRSAAHRQQRSRWRRRPGGCRHPARCAGRLARQNARFAPT